MIYNWLNNNLFRCIPKQCLLCLSVTHNNHQICSDCEADLTQNTHHCLICAAPLPMMQTDNMPLVCGQCQIKPPYFQTSFIPHLYTAPLKQLIADFKFHRNLSYAPLLAHVFVNSLTHRKNNLPECIIPVPLHIDRLRERGFNQALELARIITKQLKIPIDYSLCRRNKATPFQSGLSAKERKKNLKNAFYVTKPHHYKHVAIFDDVVTTGSTVNELAKQLKRSGVKMIEVWALARTIDKNTM